jgi:hypothetical protein
MEKHSAERLPDELVNGKYDREKCEATGKGNHMPVKDQTCLFVYSSIQTFPL